MSEEGVRGKEKGVVEAKAKAKAVEVEDLLGDEIDGMTLKGD